MQTVRYYFLSFLSFLIYLIGYLGVRLSIVVVAMGISFLTDRSLSGFGFTVGWFIGLPVGGLVLLSFQRVLPYLERLDDYAKTYKKHPFTEKFGKDYLKPKPENFGITQAEFKEYNKRFQFEYIKLLFTYGLWIAVCIYLIQWKIKGSLLILLIGVTGMVAILLNYLFDYLNERISKKHCYYEKIHKYQQALTIYFKIRDENASF